MLPSLPGAVSTTGLLKVPKTYGPSQAPPKHRRPVVAPGNVGWVCIVTCPAAQPPPRALQGDLRSARWRSRETIGIDTTPQMPMFREICGPGWWRDLLPWAARIYDFPRFLACPSLPLPPARDVSVPTVSRPRHNGRFRSFGSHSGKYNPGTRGVAPAPLVPRFRPSPVAEADHGSLIRRRRTDGRAGCRESPRDSTTRMTAARASG